MLAPVIRFGRFRLDSLARELFDGDERLSLPVSTIDCLTYLIQHRDRAVGRDELGAAVWGRADVSEVSISHAIMRLRRVLGDTGNEQNHIRTLPRLGYRWVAEVVMLAVDASGNDDVRPPPPDPRPHAPAVARATARGLALSAGAAALVVVVLWVTMRYLETVRGAAISTETTAVSADATTTAPASAVVLPATVDAGDEWSWLALGVMDLVANQFQSAGMATMPSETVVTLVNASPTVPLAARFDLASLLIVPTVARSAGIWTVRIEARDDGRTIEAEARDADPIPAARRAADDLLIRLGRTPPTVVAASDSLAQETLQRRINAAVLSGQVGVARMLIDEAPPALRDTPDIALSEASVDFFAGLYDTSAARVATLLAELDDDAPDALRARALNTLGAASFRRDRIDEAERAYSEALAVLGHDGDAGIRARAYIGLGGVASHRMRLDEAASHFGQARTLHELRGDAFGVAAVDLNLGMNAVQRGQPAAALPILAEASARFERLGAIDALVAAHVAMVDSYLMLLETDQALSASDVFGDAQSRAVNDRQRWEVQLARARALAAAGHLTEAEAAVATIFADSNPDQDIGLRLQGTGLRARMALARADPARAVTLATAALEPPLASRNRRDYSLAWLTRVEGLIASQQIDQAALDIEKIQLSNPDDAVAVDPFDVMLAAAKLASAEGKADAALHLFRDAMNEAARRAIPDTIVAAGEGYVRALLVAGHIPEAAAVSGRIAPWADRDPRPGWVQAQVYAAMGDADAAGDALAHARRLASERVLPDQP
jgi:DNA-binding winged helix-turn-helix (wHTH) protein/tetratricopeptide (TPR) repeat protein